MLGQPKLEALLAEVVRTKKEIDALADRAESAMADEGHAHERAEDQVVVRPEALGGILLERGSLRGRRLHLTS